MDKIVLVKWRDSAGNPRWQGRTEAIKEEICECESVGYLLIDNEEKVVISQSIDKTNETVNSALVIPKFAVTDIKYLRVK